MRRPGSDHWEDISWDQAFDEIARKVKQTRDATFVAIVRDDHVVMARGDTVFHPGDEVLALVTPESEDDVRRMLTGG